MQLREVQFKNKLDALRIQYKFDDYPTYAYIYNSNYKTFTDMVFKHKKQTIYKHLHQSENDTILFALTQHLYTQTIFCFYKLPTMNTGAYEKMFGFQGALEYNSPYKRTNSMRLRARNQVIENNQAVNGMFSRQ